MIRYVLFLSIDLLNKSYMARYQFIYRSLCHRSIFFERCRGGCVVGGVCFAGVHSRKTELCRRVAMC